MPKVSNVLSDNKKNFCGMKERLLKYMKYHGYAYNVFEKMCDISVGTISKINKGIRSDTLASIARVCPDLDIRWLLTGEGTMLKSEGEGIPVLPFSAVAGQLAENNTEEWPYAERCYVPEFVNRGADFLIRVEGDSMYPRYHNGELLAIRVINDPTFFQWGKVYVMSTNQGCIVKRVMPCPDDDGRIICHSENSSLYPDYSISKSDIFNVAIVVGHVGIE